MTAAAQDKTGNGILDREELVARALALQPLLREHAAKIDADRRLPDEVNTALTEAGMFRLLNPERLGGYEADMRTVMEVIEALGVADASTAWLVAVGTAASSLIGRASKQAQDEVFGSDPDARVAGGGDPAIAVRVDGGVLMSGRWSCSP
jgi:3-hydroxy-9,10-secoandrosta-1,3,5(10)-triene-9,17-dione monooxygenase